MLYQIGEQLADLKQNEGQIANKVCLPKSDRPRPYTRNEIPGRDANNGRIVKLT